MHSELVLLLEYLPTGPLTAVQIKTMTSKDPILSRVYMHILHGWPSAKEGHTLQPLAFRTYRSLPPIAPLHPWSLPDRPHMVKTAQ